MNLFDLFRRPPPPPPGPCEDWRPGDLGKCIGTGVWRDLDTGEPISGPAKGQIVVVLDVAGRTGHLGLNLRGWGSPIRFYTAASFRKLDERGEGELVERIKKLHIPTRRRELTDA